MVICIGYSVLSTQYRSLFKNLTHLQRQKQFSENCIHGTCWDKYYFCWILFLVLLFDLQREGTVKTGQAHSSFITGQLISAWDAFSSVQFSCSVVSNYIPQHNRPPCPSPTSRVCSNSCPLSRWCHPTISSSVDPFSSCPQSVPPSGSF